MPFPSCKRLKLIWFKEISNQERLLLLFGPFFSLTYIAKYQNRSAFTLIHWMLYCSSRCCILCDLRSIIFCKEFSFRKAVCKRPTLHSKYLNKVIMQNIVQFVNIQLHVALLNISLTLRTGFHSIFLIAIVRWWSWSKTNVHL